MLIMLIIIAVIAFLLVLFFFNYNSVISFVKNLFKKKDKKEKTKEKKESKPKEEPKSEPYTYEDFKPLVKDPETDRDSSIEELLNMDDFDYVDDSSFDDDNIFSGEFAEPSKKLNEFSSDSFEDLFRRYNKDNKSKKSIAQQIRELPPEIKAMVIDHLLDKRDDV